MAAIYHANKEFPSLAGRYMFRVERAAANAARVWRAVRNHIAYTPERWWNYTVAGFGDLDAHFTGAWTWVSTQSLMVEELSNGSFAIVGGVVANAADLAARVDAYAVATGGILDSHDVHFFKTNDDTWLRLADDATSNGTVAGDWDTVAYSADNEPEWAPGFTPNIRKRMEELSPVLGAGSQILPYGGTSTSGTSFLMTAGLGQDVAAETLDRWDYDSVDSVVDISGLDLSRAIRKTTAVTFVNLLLN